MSTESMVTQADREAAAPFGGLIEQEIRDGLHDGHPLVQAFASHREQATAELVEALRPFAEAAADLDDKTRDGCSMWEHHVSVNVTAGDFRRARRALQEGSRHE